MHELSVIVKAALAAVAVLNLWFHEDSFLRKYRAGTESWRSGFFRNLLNCALCFGVWMAGLAYFAAFIVADRAPRDFEEWWAVFLWGANWTLGAAACAGLVMLVWSHLRYVTNRVEQIREQQITAALESAGAATPGESTLLADDAPEVLQQTVDILQARLDAQGRGVPRE